MIHTPSAIEARAKAKYSRPLKVDNLVEPHPEWVERRTTYAYVLEEVLRLVLSKKKVIVIQALPKSGGSWISNVISEITGRTKVSKNRLDYSNLSEDDWWAPMKPYFRDARLQSCQSIEQYLDKPVLIHTHLPPTNIYADFLRNSKIDVLVLSRGLPEALRSLYYHLKVRDYEISDRLRELSHAKGVDLILDQFLSVFFRYDQFWKNWANNADMFSTDYDTLEKNPCETLKLFFDHVGEPKSKRWVSKVVNRFQKPDHPIESGMKTSLKIRYDDKSLDGSFYTDEQAELISQTMCSSNSR